MMEGGILLASVSRLQNQTQGSHLGSVAHPVPDFGQVNSPLCAFVSPCTKCITTTPRGIAVKIKQVNVSAYSTYSDWPLVNKAINMLVLFLSVMWIFSVFSLHVYLNRFLLGILLYKLLNNLLSCLTILCVSTSSVFIYSPSSSSRAWGWVLQFSHLVGGKQWSLISCDEFLPSSCPC